MMQKLLNTITSMAMTASTVMLTLTLLVMGASQPAAAQERSGSWAEQRAQIKRGWLELLGDFPTEIPELNPSIRKVTFEPGCPSKRLNEPQLQVLKEQMAEEGGSIERYHVSFQTEADDRVAAWLLVPEEALRKKTPAMICIHSTTRGTGKDQVIGLCGKEPLAPPDTSEGGRSYGLYLARNGYVTLSIDLLTDGERVEPGEAVLQSRPFYERHPEWSIVGKNTWDIMRSVDFLETLDYVDSDNIGCIGLSLGGHSSLFAGAFEPRIAATVCIGGVLDWHRGTEHWSRLNGRYIYIKKYRPYIDNPELQVPADFDELMMMVAPRPLLILCSEWEFYNRRGLLDKCLDVAQVYRDWKDTEGLPSVMEARMKRKSYAASLNYYKERYDFSAEKVTREIRGIGAGDCFSWFSYPGGHSFPPVVRALTFAWLDRWLDRDNRWFGKFYP